MWCTNSFHRSICSRSEMDAHPVLSLPSGWRAVASQSHWRVCACDCRTRRSATFKDPGTPPLAVPSYFSRRPGVQTGTAVSSRAVAHFYAGAFSETGAGIQWYRRSMGGLDRLALRPLPIRLRDSLQAIIATRRRSDLWVAANTPLASVTLLTRPRRADRQQLDLPAFWSLLRHDLFAFCYPLSVASRQREKAVPQDSSPTRWQSRLSELSRAEDSAPIVSVELAKSFGLVRVLDGVSFEVERGQMVASSGRSGSGKSMLRCVLTGGHSGRQIYACGRCVARPAMGSCQCAAMSVSVSKITIFPHLTVERNITLG